MKKKKEKHGYLIPISDKAFKGLPSLHTGLFNITLTIPLSTIAALGMMPLWIYLMGPLLTDGDLVIPFGQLVFSLIG